VADFAATTKSPTCTAYTSYLFSLAAAGSYPALAAGILPCFWIYEDVGRRLKERIGDLTGHPYADWISTYGDPEFAASTEQAKQILDRLAAQADPATVERMHEAFATASRLRVDVLGRGLAPGDLARLSGAEHQRDDGGHQCRHSASGKTVCTCTTPAAASAAVSCWDGSAATVSK